MADITDLEKLPQNIVALIGEIGEKQVLLRLSLLAHGTKWQAFYNLGEAGFDALLLKPETNEKIRIEVKTRQKLFTSGSNKRRYNFILSSGEYEACDFLVAYLLDTNDFFVVPKGDLRRRSVSGDYRFTVRLDENKHFSPDLNKYHKAWHLLHPDFATPSDAKEQDKGQKPAPSAAAPSAPIAEESTSPKYWLELEAAVAEREEERLQISRKVNADQFLQELEAKSEKLFWELEVQECLGENLPRLKELAETWDPPVFELVKQLAEASKLNTIWTIKTKIATLPGRTTPSLIWETLFQWRGRYWYVIELKLDREFQPECFRVECGERDHWIDAPVTLDGLKTALVEAYKLRFVSDQKRKELAGWILREETGKRY